MTFNCCLFSWPRRWCQAVARRPNPLTFVSALAGGVPLRGVPRRKNKILAGQAVSGGKLSWQHLRLAVCNFQRPLWQHSSAAGVAAVGAIVPLFSFLFVFLLGGGFK